MPAAFEVPARVRLDTVGAVESAGLAAIAAGTTEFSFAALADLDSSSVAMLLAWRRAAAARKATLSFAGVPDALTRLAALYGVADLLGLSATTKPAH
ncbi:hypothetical protein BH10PSE17_BH10PSE17_30740 [soil metagenome]